MEASLTVSGLNLGRIPSLGLKIAK
ncbi:hypothetical protein LINPERPRIM_LOCUS7827 [Linum perenne]